MKLFKLSVYTIKPGSLSNSKTYSAPTIENACKQANTNINMEGGMWFSRSASWKVFIPKEQIKLLEVEAINEKLS